MRLHRASPLITAIVCLLGSLGGSDAECCTTMEHLEFMVAGGNCGEFGARLTSHGCVVTVCGDGTTLDRWSNNCGHGPCNIFGCNCEGGCRRGNYGRSFLARNEGRGITFMLVERVNYAPVSRAVNSIATLYNSAFKDV